MARKLAWKDLTILHRVQDRKLVLDNSLRLVHNPGLYSSSFLSLLFPRSEFYAAVEPLSDPDCPLLFGELTLSRKDLSAKIAFLAPGEKGRERNFNSLMSHLAGRAADCGAIQILAEVPLDSQGEIILSRCGFRTYAEQQISRNGCPHGAAPSAENMTGPENKLSDCSDYCKAEWVYSGWIRPST
jgi:hypothetical protein